MAKRKTKRLKSPRKLTRKLTRPKATRRDKNADAPNVVDFEKARAAAMTAQQRAALTKATLDLDEVDVKIVELVLRYPGITQAQIGELVQLGRQAVNKRMQADKFQRALKTAQSSAIEIFQNNQTAAARKLGALIHDQDPRVALRAAIAHLWPFIHQRDSQDDGDFVTFLQDAYHRAEAERKPAKTDGGGG